MIEKFDSDFQMFCDESNSLISSLLSDHSQHPQFDPQLLQSDSKKMLGYYLQCLEKDRKLLNLAISSAPSRNSLFAGIMSLKK